jgi:crotonobetainyl-CoA:carnitine CoA-transferase CaiB-like acyl-CoA transferase
VTGPLADLRVVAIEQYGAGPFGTLQLADLGAEVIKVEDPSVGGDVSRYIPPYQDGTDSLFFESFNRNKRSISLDLRHPEARTVLEDLVRVSDAVFSNLRGDQPEKLRIRFEDLEPVNPRIVCVSLSGFGMTGPRAREGGYDYTVQGLAGWMALTGGPDQPPTKSGLSLVDFCAGYVAAIATLGGVWQARRDGRGCDADVSLFETALAQLNYLGTWVASQGFEPRRMANSAHQTVVPFQAFATSDGWIMIACPKQRLWEQFCTAIERPELPGDARFADFAARDRNRDVLVPLLAEVLTGRSTDEWLAKMAAHGVPSGPVNDVQEALAEAQAVARGDVVEYEHPTLGVVRGPASPIRLSVGASAPVRGPRLGEHTHDVLRELCGYGDERLAQLATAGVFGAASRPRLAGS